MGGVGALLNSPGALARGVGSSRRALAGLGLAFAYQSPLGAGKKSCAKAAPPLEPKPYWSAVPARVVMAPQPENRLGDRSSFHFRGQRTANDRQWVDQEWSIRLEDRQGRFGDVCLEAWGRAACADYI